MTPSADQSARILTCKLLAGEPFVFVRLGDADVPWMMGSDGITETCDGEPNRPGLREELLAAWWSLCCSPIFLCGDLLTMEDPATEEVRQGFHALCAPYPQVRMLHSEALLIHRLSPALKEFYRAVREDPRRKILVAPHRIAGAADFLDASHLAIHSTHAHESVNRAFDLLVSEPWEIVLLVAGRASKLLAGRLAQSGKTVIELGSALDPLFYGRTRDGQVEPEHARNYFADLWWGRL